MQGDRIRRGRKKVCNFCVEKIEGIDYKDVNRLKKYISERAKIMPRRMTGVCSKHQRMLTVAIKRARQLAMMPYVGEWVVYIKKSYYSFMKHINDIF